MSRLIRALLPPLALVGCAATVDVPPLTMSRVTEITIHGDTRFTDEERRECERAAMAWGRLTSDRARIAIRWDVTELTFLDTPLPMLYRSPKSPETADFGGNVAYQIVRLVPETCRERASVQACAQHEFGHLLGLEHVPEAGQVMSAHNPAHVFGVADRRECVRAGVCASARRDTTSVTVTIDPAIPHTSPEYP